MTALSISEKALFMRSRVGGVRSVLLSNFFLRFCRIVNTERRQEMRKIHSVVFIILVSIQ